MGQSFAEFTDELQDDNRKLRATNADLLAALESVLSTHLPKDDMMLSGMNARRDARAAINKARGA